MLKLIAFGFAVILLVAVVAVLVSYFRLSAQIEGDVQRLVAAAQPSRVVVTDDMLTTLPELAQRYLRRAGVVGQPIPKLVHLRQKGRIRSSNEANWMKFEAAETYSTNPPALVWRAWFPTQFLPIVMGRDVYLDGEGSILMRMLAMLTVAEERGEELRAAGLMRYLNEMVWFPTAFLGTNVTISSSGESSFKVALTDRGLTAEAELFVDAEGRFINFRAARYNTGSSSSEMWETPITAWAMFGALELPSHGSALWKLPAGDLTYIDLEITQVSYQ